MTSPKDELHTIFTPSQLQKIKKAGYSTLFGLISQVTPRGVKTVVPFDFERYHQIQNTYLFEGELETAIQKKGKAPFWVCSFLDSKQKSHRFYLFSRATFMKQMLKPKTIFQLLVAKQKSYFVIQSISPKREMSAENRFVLGKAELKKWCLPMYPKISGLHGGFWSRVFLSIPQSRFIFDFTGLSGTSTIISQKIDFSKIHFPSCQEDYEEAFQQWIIIKTYLKMVLNAYNTLDSMKYFGKSINLERAYLTELSEFLPYSLTISQKNTIWEILYYISKNKV